MNDDQRLLVGSSREAADLCAALQLPPHITWFNLGLRAEGVAEVTCSYYVTVTAGARLEEVFRKLRFVLEDITGPDPVPSWEAQLEARAAEVLEEAHRAFDRARREVNDWAEAALQELSGGWWGARTIRLADNAVTYSKLDLSAFGRGEITGTRAHAPLPAPWYRRAAQRLLWLLGRG